MNLLVIGSGGREHAIAWKVAKSPSTTTVWVAPGNAGTALEPKTQNVNIPVDDVDQLLHFAQAKNIDLTIVGPEAALAAGIVDRFNEAGLACFGPTKKAACLETSKSFCKDFMKQHGIPTAQYATFNDSELAMAYIRNQTLPVVIKADGLAAGKGVVIAETTEQAFDAIKSMLVDKQFGLAGESIVIEEYLSGREISYIVMSDGQHILPLASCQDHKRRDNGNKGPNTGGMGAFSPAPHFGTELEQTIIQQVILPTIKGMQEQGTPYIGFLYAGLMITPEGEPKVLEFNCRLGDPETQPILMRLQSDLADLCFYALKGELNQASIQWDKRCALAVVLTAGGYPLNYRKGDIISGIDKHNEANYKIFHAGTAIADHHIVTNGGRVLAVTALGDDLSHARKQAYAITKTITWPDCYYRSDIGHLME